MDDQQQARRRAEVILQVRSGQITARQGAKLLGISRKGYYQWEKRGLQGMLDGLCQKEAGRPPKPSDPETQALRQRIAQLESRLALAEQTAEVRAVLMDMRRAEQKRDAKKKRGR